VSITVEVEHISDDWHELAGVFTLCGRKEFEFSSLSSGSLIYDPKIFPLFLVSLRLLLIRCWQIQMVVFSELSVDEILSPVLLTF
jgi:hypothetical protein